MGMQKGKRLYLTYGARDHQIVNYPSKGQRSVMPIAPIPKAARRNPVHAGRGTPLPPQRQVFKQSQRRARASRERGQAFNLTAEEAEASEKVVAGTILVHSFSVISLFDFDALHCYISTSFVMMHSIPYYDMDTQ